MSSGFYNSGFTFDDVVLRGELGGRRAVQQYLNMRIKMMRRHYGDFTASGHDGTALQDAIGVFVLTEQLVEDYYNSASQKQQD